MRLAKEAQQSAYNAIECDPHNDVAHHLMGRCVPSAPSPLAWRVCRTAAAAPRRCLQLAHGLAPAMLQPAARTRALRLTPLPPHPRPPCSWHYEMAQINYVIRTLVRLMYGTSLSTGKKADALASFRRAAELAPHRLIHK